MVKKIFAYFLCSYFMIPAIGQNLPLTAGMKISHSVIIKKGVYRIGAKEDISSPVILIEGDNITVDFSNAELMGSNPENLPDEFAGLAILIRNSKNVTIRNLKANGYKIALRASNVEKLVLENCDFSYNYRPRLNSTPEKEDVSDWMSYHHNEKDEWLRYGAAMYLRNCNSATIRNCKVTGGQNALMMTECNDGRIFNNDFSFNSGIGIGMYRSSRNQVMYNRVIFNVRGYSHGVYNRGQDSAGMLVYEQSNNNTFYKNNVTHGGDGFFLWAGQTTMDTGEGGCNDNLLYGNDFSYAPTNGVEVTFSRNKIISNRIFECDHGIWGGYSYTTIISDNMFRDNRVAIAIEHGQENEIWYNTFSKDKEAIRLWGRKEQPADWGYAKNRDTRSYGYRIAGNSFNANELAINLSRTTGLQVFANTFSTGTRPFKIDSLVTDLDTLTGQLVDFAYKFPDTVIKKTMDPFKGSGKYAGRKNIRITEWGPYDFRSPIIWNTNPVDKADTMKFDLVGPAGGKWRIIASKGITGISKKSGGFPSSITAIKNKSELTDILAELEYSGPAIITPFGKSLPAGKTYRFYFKQFFQPIDWEVLFYSMDTAFYNPLKTGDLFSPIVRMVPFKTEKVLKLDYAWWGGIKADGKTYPQFLTVAEGQATLTPGEYELSVTWDDALRVYLDDKLVIDEWNPSKYSFDESPNRKIRIKLGGDHRFRVEHVELGGFAVLSLKIKPVEPW
ncbi:MAG: right-handed parallel beta-helix repeat-containing protein [Chitinophagaceae bacterium]